MLDVMTKTENIWDKMDDMFRTMDAWMQYPTKAKTLETQGLKRIITRPHNLINVKDEDGKIVAQKLEVVTTPFKKDEVKVTVEDDSNTLTIRCGESNQEDNENENYVYRGISSQNYTFSLKMGSKIDKDAIKAKNQDGVLTITLPFKQEKESEKTKKVTNIEIE